MLSVEVYSDDSAVSGDQIAALINQNKNTFSLAVNDAVVGGSSDNNITVTSTTVNYLANKDRH